MPSQNIALPIPNSEHYQTLLTCVQPSDPIGVHLSVRNYIQSPERQREEIQGLLENNNLLKLRPNLSRHTAARLPAADRRNIPLSQFPICQEKYAANNSTS